MRATKLAQYYNMLTKNCPSPSPSLYIPFSVTGDPIFSRMYATWLLLSTVIRVTFALSSEVSPSLYGVTLATYVVALWHFALEIFVYHTAPLSPGGIAPLSVASVSIIALLLLRSYILTSSKSTTYIKRQ